MYVAIWSPKNAQAVATKLPLQDPCHIFAPLRTAGSTPPPAEPPKEVVGILEDGEPTIRSRYSNLRGGGKINGN